MVQRNQLSLLVVLFSAGLLPWLRVQAAEDEPVEYGVDVSYPMHYQAVSTNYEWLPHNVHPAQNPTPPAYQDKVVQPLGDRQREADDFLAGCVDFYGIKGHRCLSNEKTRVEMNLRQPKSVSNYTSTGFIKIRAPTEVFAHIKKFWDANREKGKPESWNTGNIYVNHWESPSLMVSVEDRALEFGGGRLKSLIWEAARETVSAWTGQQLAECSLYGIRIYHEGAMLAPHVDRLPLVASAIINVDQDVDEPWPLEVIGHDGKAHNVTMVPGDMILYESHSIIHGRPFALQGRFMANVFIHFEPVGPVGGVVAYTGDLPPYLIPGSPEEPIWRKQNPGGHKLTSKFKFTTGSSEAHRFAGEGKFDSLVKLLDQHGDELVHNKDMNGWTPLHEAARVGNLNVLQLLLQRGADVNVRTGKYSNGASPLYFAAEYHGNKSEVVDFLRERGAEYLEPEL